MGVNISQKAQNLGQIKSPVGLPLQHDSARMHVQGSAQYIDDIAEPNGTLHVAFALSNVAHGKIQSINIDDAKKAQGVHSVLIAEEIEKVIRDQAAAISKELEGNPKPQEKISDKNEEDK